EQLESLFEDIFLIAATGRATSIAGLEELLGAFGVSLSELTNRKINGAPPIKALVEALRPVQAAVMRQTVTTSSVAELERARDDIQIVRRLARRYSESVPTQMESGWGLSLRAVAAMTD